MQARRTISLRLAHMLPSLADATLTAIARATGISSTSNTAKVRSEKRMPHPSW
jgi:hypothetical protein